MRLITPLLLFACLWIAPLNAQADRAGPSSDPNSVQIHIEHGIVLPWGAPGFRIDVSGWNPGEALSIHAIAPDGATIALIPAKKPLHADQSGRMTVDIDYQRKGLTPGHWLFLIAGKPGIHMSQADLPSIEAPTSSNPKWRLTFGAKNRDGTQKAN